jgi:dTDP-4-dehydrorhamnose 3,5-epimerase-like enzyme
LSIITNDREGYYNGWLLPLWHVDDGEQIDQVYLTVVEPGMSKGPHLHHRRRGRFTCVKGNVLIVLREQGGYRELWSGEDHHFAVVRVPPGIPAAIYNGGLDHAYVLNMPSPPWRPDEDDENSVSDWDYAP